MMILIDDEISINFVLNRVKRRVNKQKSPTHVSEITIG